MDPKAYEQMAKLEDEHWWFVGRRRIFSRVIETLALPSPAHILEAGCGSGGNLKMLSQFGKVWGMEKSEFARPLAQARQIGIVAEGELPDRIPFEGQQFDLIALLDVLEHLEQDRESLKALKSRLTSTGYLLVTVPAYPWLWSSHDELNHHKRRYTRPQLLATLEHSDLEVHTLCYFNSVLFPLIAGIRLFRKIVRLPESQDLKMPSPWLNQLLTSIFSAEAYLIPRFALPFGLSLLAVASPVRMAFSQHLISEASSIPHN
ncbi:methyltransferase domain-containing protein [Synechococcus bigranulatus str. 'Rupite']|uniref:Methyltransferase domain-containing protein n=2 Tax=Thermostichus vulcanus TaxID=32053 RepID=A0ABT0C8N1_THEVL|nr:methyltransferase domain-containing protein [Thermostichus vulcanus str. 'Rupite']